MRIIRVRCSAAWSFVISGRRVSFSIELSRLLPFDLRAQFSAGVAIAFQSWAASFGSRFPAFPAKTYMMARGSKITESLPALTLISVSFMVDLFREQHFLGQSAHRDLAILLLNLDADGPSTKFPSRKQG